MMPHVIELKWEVDLHRQLRAIQVGNGLRAGGFMQTSARNCPCTATSFFLVALVIHQSVLIVINNLDAPSTYVACTRGRDQVDSVKHTCTRENAENLFHYPEW